VEYEHLATERIVTSPAFASLRDLTAFAAWRIARALFCSPVTN
jgi:hypothetical protein